LYLRLVYVLHAPQALVYNMKSIITLSFEEFAFGIRSGDLTMPTHMWTKRCSIIFLLVMLLDYTFRRQNCKNWISYSPCPCIIWNWKL